MKIQTNITESRVKLFFAILFALCFAIPALAKVAPGYLAFQIDPEQRCIIRQNGIKVGEIFAPVREPGATNYVEHWVLYDNFVYIGKDRSMATTIEASQESYKSEEDFFARVP